MCEKCQLVEVAQYDAKRPAHPAYVAYVGAQDLADNMLSIYQEVPEGQSNADRARNNLFHLEGLVVTRYARK